MSAHPARNAGLEVSGGTVSFGGDVNAAQHNHPVGPAFGTAGDGPAERSADVGILTVLWEETAAVVELLRRARDYRIEQVHGGGTVHR
ncbi:hypothetical protein E1258_26840, partial [Micromonospora sp. KC207]|uniref:hypothetical protein n=1 Tax=Micromonospora sp. KC207 TaxID=2530377 RepID=UPI001052434E